jgi:sporulation protein YlmC with PRC-barrel domain
MAGETTGKRRDLALHLLDRQVVGSDGGMVGNVDDVELTDDGQLVALLTGPQALAGRLGGRLGALLQLLSEGLSRRSTSEPVRIPVELVTDYGTVISVARTREELGAGANEERFRSYVIGRIPGADHESG